MLASTVTATATLAGVGYHFYKALESQKDKRLLERVRAQFADDKVRVVYLNPHDMTTGTSGGVVLENGRTYTFSQEQGALTIEEVSYD